jgi:ABC-type Zn uptake system ZnuABC Zn-binding protein ZnuA
MSSRIAALILLLMVLTGCGRAPSKPTDNSTLQGIATESFLADIARNISGERIVFSSLIPPGMDPHAFEPVPSDIVNVSQSVILVQNGAGLETWLMPILENASGERLIVEASRGLTGRDPSPAESNLVEKPGGLDPHFWLDPNLVVTYVENIREGLIQVDPAGAYEYNTRADGYIAELVVLDSWIKTRVEEIPAEERLLVTNHETLGYFADHYGFTVIGTIIPATTSGITPGARELAELEDRILATGVKAIFVETEGNIDLASQIGRDTGVRVITGLFTHSLSGPDGPAPTYIDMMKHNVNLIVNSLAGNE